jgi:uncharacterized protein DUF1573
MSGDGARTRTSIARLGCALVLATVACGRGEPPRLAVRSQPPLAAGAVVDTRFRLQNVGGDTLVLDDLVSACGCVPASRLPTSLAPGAGADLDVRCRPPREVGKVVRELRLRSNDPANPETPLDVTLAGTGAGPEPSALYFGYVAVGDSAVRDVVLPLAPGDLAPAAHPELIVEALPPRADGAHGVRVRFTPRAASIVRTSIDLGPTLGALPVTAVGYDAVMAFPAEVRLPRPTGASGLPSITLIANGAAPLAITQVDYPAGISGELRTIAPGRQFRLLLRRHGPLEHDASIRVRRAAGTDPILVIPVVDATGDGQPRPPA